MSNIQKPLKFNCPVLGGIANLTIIEMYSKVEQLPPVHKGNHLENCTHKDVCGIKIPGNGYDWVRCPAYVTLSKGGNL